MTPEEVEKEMKELTERYRAVGVALGEESGNGNGAAPGDPLDAPPAFTIKQWLEGAEAAVDGEKADVKEILPALAALAPLDYEQARERVAKAAGIRVSALDAAVEAIRPKGESTGATASLIEVPPHGAAVDGGELLNDISAWITSYVVLPGGAAETIATWIIATWLRPCLYFAPILAVLSPTKRSGKTTLFDLLLQVVSRGFLTSGFGVTPAVLFRLNQTEHPTFLIDEAEKLAHDDAARDLIGLLNAGYRRGSTVPRCVGDKFEIQLFDAFGFRAIAAIGRLWDTILDRSIIIPMKRKKGEMRGRFNARQVEVEGKGLAAKISRWASDNQGTVSDLDGKAERPAWLNDRAADNWSSLFIIGKAVGGAWEEKLLDAAKKLEAKEADATGLGEMLLHDIEGAFREKKEDFMRSADLVNALNKLESSPWADWNGGKGLSTVKLASMLKDFDIKPGQHWAGEKVRGYALVDFGDAFARYISVFQPGSPVEPNTDAGFSEAGVGMGESVLPGRSRYEKGSPTDSEVTNANAGAGSTDSPGQKPIFECSEGEEEVEL